jgi:chromosome partitioning protein
MRSIAIMNQKGGVGKTTTAVNISAALAETGLRICLIDLDPQAHATLHLGIEPRPGVPGAPDQPSIYDVLTGKTRLSEVRRQVAENLWVVGSTLDLAAADLELAGVVGREMILRDKLDAEEQPFDYMLVDCPPSLGVLTLNALVAVDEVFIPLQPHFLALHGLSKLLETINLVSVRLNPRLKISGVVLCMYDVNTRLAGEVSDNVDQFFRAARDKTTPWSGARTFQTRIRRNVRLAEAPSFGQSIFQYSPDSHGAEDYRRLAEEVAKTGPASRPA